MLKKEDFGERIKKARELYGEKIGVTLTQAALARKIGVSRVYLIVYNRMMKYLRR